MKASFCLYAALLVLQASLIPALEGTEASQQPNECLAKVDVEVASLSSCSNEVDATFQAQRTGTRKPYKRPEFCQDVLNDCKARMENDACIHYFDFMSENCAKSCQICSTRDPNAKTIANHKKGIVERIFAQIPQVIEGKASIDTWFHMRQVEDYMYNHVYVNDEFQDVRVDCQARHELCTFWAATGECENNRKYMRITCAPACQTCLDLKFENRCPLDQSGPTALSKPGDLFRMFERIMSDPQLQRYNPKPILRPSNLTLDDAPWLIVLEDFLSKEECETLIAQGNARGYKPSSEAGTKKRYDGRHESTRSDRRTSSTTWCKKECASHPVAESVHERLEKLTGINQQNYEPLQLLKYEVGEKYTQHHDYLNLHLERNQGARMLTVYMYLNDVTAGGGTRFPDLNVTVTPKQGRVAIWPSVLDSDTSMRDPRTEHEALPVEWGIKYGANAWIHQRDFKTPHANGCT